MEIKTEMNDLPKLNIRCETREGNIHGSTNLNVIRVEAEDDGSFTAITDYWPSDNSPPQPKPADAAGLRPEWSYSHYRATLKRNGQFFALVTPDGKKSLDAGDADQLLDALNHSAHVPAPPHAAEVRAGDVVEEIRQLFVGRHTAAALLIWEYREHIAAILARHPAAETVGTGGDWPFPYECEKCGRTYADPDHLGTPWQCECGGALKTLPKLYPTPPATQSALEAAECQIDNALAALGWTFSPTKGWGFPPGQCEAVQIPPLAEIITTRGVETLKALESANDEIRQFRKEANDEASRHGTPTVPYKLLENPKVTAAINAVLPPAKGGDGV